MNHRDELARVAVRDARYTIDAYEFVFATIVHSRHLRKQAAQARRAKGKRPRRAGIQRHVTGQELCLAARDLALEHYGRMAYHVMSSWGLRSTADLGNVVYNLIDSGDLEKNERDELADFDDVFDFEAQLSHAYQLDLDEAE